MDWTHSCFDSHIRMSPTRIKCLRKINEMKERLEKVTLNHSMKFLHLTSENALPRMDQEPIPGTLGATQACILGRMEVHPCTHSFTPRGYLAQPIHRMLLEGNQRTWKNTTRTRGEHVNFYNDSNWGSGTTPELCEGSATKCIKTHFLLRLFLFSSRITGQKLHEHFISLSYTRVSQIKMCIFCFKCMFIAIRCHERISFFNRISISFSA